MASLKERVLDGIYAELRWVDGLSVGSGNLLRVLRDAVEREEDVLPLGHRYIDALGSGGSCWARIPPGGSGTCPADGPAHAPQPGPLTRATAAALGMEE